MNLLLIDAHSQGYYHQQSAAKLLVGEREVQAVFNTIRNIRRYASILKAHPVMLWDGKPVKRCALFPGYKKRKARADMEAMKEKFKDQRPDIQLMCSQLGVTQQVAEDGEADDLAGLMVARMKEKVGHIYLLSGDGDWMQLVGDNVTYINQRDELKTTPANFLENTGYATPKAFVEGKALVGDTSDKIDGVGGIGDNGARELLAEYGSVLELVRSVRAGEELRCSHGRYRKPFLALANNTFNEKGGDGALNLFIRNLKLMNIIQPQLGPDTIRIIPPAIDPEGFRQKCLELNFQTFLDDLDIFLIPFRRYCGVPG
ncbi:exonuclease [Klebsiella pneumoniae]|nr:exonuclease [Klebsiella pneumoniae]